MRKLITGTIVEAVGGYTGSTSYRQPLVGFTAADNPGFIRLREAVGPTHQLPQDLLPNARSVIAFFLPFTRDLVRLNRSDPYISRAWAEAYVETNRLIDDICRALAGVLISMGVRTAWQQPTHNFDQLTLTSFWSHKHVAYLCGLGGFGRHQMLITEAGCAGRLGSLAIDADLPETGTALPGTADLPPGEFLAKRCRDCSACIRSCPSGALTENGLNKQVCYNYLLQVSDHFQDLGLCDVCGKCATGPCALKAPGMAG